MQVDNGVLCGLWNIASVRISGVSFETAIEIIDEEGKTVHKFEIRHSIYRYIFSSM